LESHVTGSRYLLGKRSALRQKYPNRRQGRRTQQTRATRRGILETVGLRRKGDTPYINPEDLVISTPQSPPKKKEYQMETGAFIIDHNKSMGSKRGGTNVVLHPPLTDGAEFGLLEGRKKHKKKKKEGEKGRRQTY